MTEHDDPRGAPDIDGIRSARERIRALFPATPILRLPGPWDRSGREVFLKAESLQVTGSFKIRGATHRIARLRRPGGVIAASAGNHAQGVALAASMNGRPATIVMPEETPLIKVDRTRALGAEVILHGASFEEALARARALEQERGLTFVHAYEDRDVMAGQGTVAMEILEALPDVGSILVPVGGGGLISGIAIAVRALAPGVEVIGVQAAGAAPVCDALRPGAKPPAPPGHTIADAIRFKGTSDVTLPLVRAHVDDVVGVTDEEIAGAILHLMEESKLIAEAAGAVGVAALMADRVVPRGRKCCVVISGGNIDLNLIARVVEQGLSRADRYLVVRCRIPDRPGRLFAILSHLADRKINVMDVRHNRAGWRIPLGQVEVEILVETRNEAHAAEIVASIRQAGFEVERAERGREPGEG